MASATVRVSIALVFNKVQSGLSKELKPPDQKFH